MHRNFQDRLYKNNNQRCTHLRHLFQDHRDLPEKTKTEDSWQPDQEYMEEDLLVLPFHCNNETNEGIGWIQEAINKTRLKKSAKVSKYYVETLLQTREPFVLSA